MSIFNGADGQKLYNSSTGLSCKSPVPNHGEQMDSGFIYCVLLGLINRLVLMMGVAYNLSLFKIFTPVFFLAYFLQDLTICILSSEHLQGLPFLQYGTHPRLCTNSFWRDSDLKYIRVCVWLCSAQWEKGLYRCKPKMEEGVIKRDGRSCLDIRIGILMFSVEGTSYLILRRGGMRASCFQELLTTSVMCHLSLHTLSQTPMTVNLAFSCSKPSLNQVLWPGPLRDTHVPLFAWLLPCRGQPNDASFI